MKSSTSEKTATGKLSLGQAVANLTGVPYLPKKVSVWQRIAFVEKWARSDTSIYAFKTVS
jgi:hypothetical protein